MNGELSTHANGLTSDYSMDPRSSHDFEPPHSFREPPIGKFNYDFTKKNEYVFAPNILSIPLEFYTCPYIDEPHETPAGELHFPPAPSFHVVSHVSPKTAQICADLDSFTTQKLNLTHVESVKVRKGFFAALSQKMKDEETLSFEESATMLKGIILATSKIGEALKKEMSR